MAPLNRLDACTLDSPLTEAQLEEPLTLDSLLAENQLEDAITLDSLLAEAQLADAPAGCAEAGSDDLATWQRLHRAASAETQPCPQGSAEKFRAALQDAITLDSLLAENQLEDAITLDSLLAEAQLADAPADCAEAARDDLTAWRLLHRAASAETQPSPQGSAEKFRAALADAITLDSLLAENQLEDAITLDSLLAEAQLENAPDGAHAEAACDDLAAWRRLHRAASAGPRPHPKVSGEQFRAAYDDSSWQALDDLFHLAFDELAKEDVATAAADAARTRHARPRVSNSVLPLRRPAKTGGPSRR